MRGSPASTADAPLWVVSPHSCILDMIVVSMFHLPTYVAKREVRSTPLFGRESPPSLTSVTSHMRLSLCSLCTDLITHTLRTIYVARDDPSSRKQCTAEIVRRSQNREAGWPKVMLFPEATTHSNEVLLQFKKGAFLPGVPVQVHCRVLTRFAQTHKTCLMKHAHTHTHTWLCRQWPSSIGTESTAWCGVTAV